MYMHMYIYICTFIHILLHEHFLLVFTTGTTHSAGPGAPAASVYTYIHTYIHICKYNKDIYTNTVYIL